MSWQLGCKKGLGALRNWVSGVSKFCFGFGVQGFGFLSQGLAKRIAGEAMRSFRLNTLRCGEPDAPLAFSIVSSLIIIV